VQPLRLPEDMDVRAVYQELLERGIQPVLHSNSDSGDVQCSFVLTARHRLIDIDKTLEALVHAIAISIAREKKGRAGHEFRRC
jgi:hypothetical protein